MKRILFVLLLFFCISVKAIDLDNIYSKNILLYDFSSKNIIYEVNAEEKISIASLTKIMTIIFAIENIKDINELVTIKQEHFYLLNEKNASLAGFKLNERVTYLDLLYGSMLPSGGEAVQALAIEVSSNLDGFVKLMNNKAKELGMEKHIFQTLPD